MSSDRVEADDTVDQIEAEQEFGAEVSAYQRLDDNAVRKPSRLFATRRNRLPDRNRIEPERGSWPRLSQSAEIGANDGSNLGITAGRLTIGHQNDRTPGPRHRDRPHRDAGGHDVVPTRVR